jgi:hypothetical protein
MICNYRQLRGKDVRVSSWLASIVFAWACFTGAVHAQEALVLDTYTCSQFLADLGDRADTGKVRRSLMMIAWAAGYAAARQQDSPSSLEVIAATLGDACRNSPAEKAVKAISDKINESANRSAARVAPAAPPAPSPPAAAPAPPAASLSAPPASPSASGRSFTAYGSRDMEGGDYQIQRGISLDQCEDRCKGDSRCQAFSYDVWNRLCFLKSSINPLRLEPRTVTSVPAGIAVTYDDREPVIQRRPQKAFPNEPYLQASAQSYDDCAQRCLKDKRCEAFNFYQFTRRCNLIEKPKEYSDARGAEIGIKVQAPK